MTKLVGVHELGYAWQQMKNEAKAGGVMAPAALCYKFTKQHPVGITITST